MHYKEEAKTQIHTFVETHRQDMLSLWEDLVNTPSGSREPDAVCTLSAKLKCIFEDSGFDCNLYDVGASNGPALTGIWGKERTGKPIIFSGHYDTVSLPGQHPFYIDDKGKTHGLGCLDMKGGIVIAAYVVKALQSLGWAERPILFIFLGDEEIGHAGAITPDIITQQAHGALCAFNMETGLISNDICISRKGGLAASFTVRGVAAHAGNDFLAGRNAIADMAYKILDLQALTNLELGTTVSVTQVRGGTVPNSIPDECHVTVDTRITCLSERDRVVTAFSEIAGKVYIDGCKTEYSFHEALPPFETTSGTEALANFIEKVSVESGLGDMGQTKLGGGSDASYLTITGVPTVCSMGVQGEFNHTEREYAITESLFKRTELLSNVILRIDEYINI